MPSTNEDNLNIKPQWLEEVLKENPQPKEKYIAVRDLANMIGANPHNFAKWLQRKGIKPVKRTIGGQGPLMYCVTEDQAKEIVKRRIKEGYSIET